LNDNMYARQPREAVEAERVWGNQHMPSS
jgi:hypothetical protein